MIKYKDYSQVHHQRIFSYLVNYSNILTLYVHDLDKIANPIHSMNYNSNDFIDFITV